MRRDTGLFIIIVYKLLRAALSLGACVALLGFRWSGHDEVLSEAAEALRHHLASHWSSVLADAVVRAVTPENVTLAAAALGFDGVLVAIEGWALWHGRRWGPWIVVISTAALLPFEGVGLWRHPRLGRLLLLVGNLAVALYLLRRVVRARSVST